jgi:sensor c-di-GMP phosphodiesterase-like protein
MRKLGCCLMQGFYVTGALPEEQFLEWSRNYEAVGRAA